MKKPLPIGVDLFEKVISKDYFYIDKTLLIKELLDYKSEVTLITRPRRFGKTLNMSMLQCFFDVQLGHEHLFDGLKIMQHKEIIEEYQNKYPVIFLSLKSVKGTTFESTLALLAKSISKLYKKYKYLYDSGMMIEIEKTEFNTYLNKKASTEELMLSLKILMESLYAYHKKKVVLLIDEYDAPIDNAELKAAMEGLLMDEPILMEIGEHITYPISYEVSDALCTMLLNAGYLKIIETIPDELSAQYKAVLVNNEVKVAFRHCIRQWRAMPLYINMGLPLAASTV